MPQAAFIDWPAFTTLDRLLNRLRVEVRVWLQDDAVSGLAAVNVCSGIQSREPSVCESAAIDALSWGIGTLNSGLPASAEVGGGRC
jgi:hypothetical protein